MMGRVSLTLTALSVSLACGSDSDTPSSLEGGASEMQGDAGGSPNALSPDAGVEASDAGSADDAADDGVDAGAEDGVVDAGVAEPRGSAGCALGEPALPEGETRLRVEGRERRFLLRLPRSYSSARAWPLVFALPPNGGGAGYWDGTGGDRDLRDALEDDAILVVTEAIDRRWRDYDAPESTWSARIEEELLYFDELIERTKAGLCVDEDAIFAIGFSGGGSFSGVLGCRRSDIRAFAAGGSVIYFDREDCVGESAAWITIGEGELNGGREAYRDYFRERAGCAMVASPTDPDPCVAYEGCAAATPVHYCQHEGGHRWPNFGVAAAWQFFESFAVAPRARGAPDPMSP